MPNYVKPLIWLPYLIVIAFTVVLVVKLGSWLAIFMAAIYIPAIAVGAILGRRRRRERLSGVPRRAWPLELRKLSDDRLNDGRSVRPRQR